MAEGGVKDWGHDLQVGLDALSEAERRMFGAVPPRADQRASRAGQVCASAGR
jgi:hypothetical protein